ncbi:hypothetical protein GCM10017673_38420 [Streptosporangium violaceochromogenes]|nr:hypothetical protein GCM10017673_38420 [Streptosporangium violaceochromogenes]
MATDRQKYDAALRAQQRARELSPTPVPYRITTALDMRELYGPEVDRALGGEEPMVDQWESGELVPTRAQIEALAKLTDYPPDFFYWPVEAHERRGTTFLCSRSRPKGKRCEITTLGPPAPQADAGALPPRRPQAPRTALFGPCGYGSGPCQATPTRPYPEGPRCARHAPGSPARADHATAPSRPPRSGSFR